METLFFNSDESIRDVVSKIFNVLNITNLAEGESSSYLNDTYFVGNVLGIDIKISENNYDYEDDFNFMISIKKSIGTKLKDENGLYVIAEIVASVIAMKLNIAVAIEQKDSNSNYLLNFSKLENELLVQKKII